MMLPIVDDVNDVVMEFMMFRSHQLVVTKIARVIEQYRRRSRIVFINVCPNALDVFLISLTRVTLEHVVLVSISCPIANVIRVKHFGIR